MIYIKDLKENYPDFRTLNRQYKRKHIEEALNYYEDNENVTASEIEDNFVFTGFHSDILIDIFDQESEK